jgi:HD-GYP domain-containing protein (c-di-GMP phosphodiesterase class II)
MTVVSRPEELMSAQRLLAVLEVQNEIVSTRLDLDAVMALVAERAAQITGADAGVVELAEGEEMVYRAVSGRAAGHLGLRLSVAQSLSGQSLRHGVVLHCDDATADPRVDAEACRRVGAASMVCVPLRHRGVAEGVLKVYSARAFAFDAEDIGVLAHLSSVIAAHMHHAAEYQRVDHESQLNRGQALAGLRALARAIDAKDHTTRQHSDRVAALARAIALRLGWSADRARRLHEAGLVHDVGKIGIPDAILLKPGRLTAEEYEQVKAHAALGATIVEDVLGAEQVEWVRWHHERPDGQGYPDRLDDAAIPEGAAIIALADSWDVMTVSRPYSPPKPPGLALTECQRLAGRQFRAALVDVLADIV